MKEDINDEETQVEQLEGQADVQPQPEQQAQVVDGGAEDFKALLTKQNARIKELEGQVAEAAKTKANADKLTAEIEQVKAQAADEYVEFQLKLAGVRNVKVAEACSPTTTATLSRSRRPSRGSSWTQKLLQPQARLTWSLPVWPRTKNPT